MPLAVSMSSYGCTREVRRALKKLVALGYVLSNSYASLVLSKLQAYIHNLIYFFQACERAESSKSCNLIGSESGRYFTILPANPGGIVGSFIHKFVWHHSQVWMSKNRHFQTIFLLKLFLLLALAREKWILLSRQKESSKSARKTAKVKQNRWLVMSLHELYNRAVSTAILPLCTIVGHFCSVSSFVFHFCCMNLDSDVFHWILPR